MWTEQHKSGKVNFIERYKDPYTDKWKRVSILMDKDTPRIRKEAQKILDEKIKAKLEQLKTSDALFNTVFEEWLIHYKSTIKNSSYQTILSKLELLKNEFALGVSINRITPKYINSFLVSKPKWSYSKKYRIKSILNIFFDYACQLELITENPARKVKLPKPQKKHDLTGKFLEKDELQRLLKELYRKTITYRYAMMAEFMSLNGCRVGELGAITNQKYNPGNKTIDIHATTTRYDEIPTEPKTTASYRTVALSNREVEIIEEFQRLNKLEEETNPNWLKSDYIFLTNTGSQVSSTIIARSLQRANERLDQPIPKHLSSHIFRHTLISTLAEHNVPIKAIMDRVGHSDSGTTTQIYTHVTKGMRDQAIDVLNNL